MDHSFTHSFIHLFIYLKGLHVCFCLLFRYWPVIENALIRSVFERNVTMRVLISCGRDSDSAILPFLKSLNALNSASDNIRIEVVRSTGTLSESLMLSITSATFTIDQYIVYLESYRFFSSNLGCSQYECNIFTFHRDSTLFPRVTRLTFPIPE